MIQAIIMEQKSLALITFSVIGCLLLIVFLIYQNWKDIKKVNLDASNAPEETRNDQEMNKDKT